MKQLFYIHTLLLYIFSCNSGVRPYLHLPWGKKTKEDSSFHAHVRPLCMCSCDCGLADQFHCFFFLAEWHQGVSDDGAHSHLCPSYPEEPLRLLVCSESCTGRGAGHGIHMCLGCSQLFWKILTSCVWYLNQNWKRKINICALFT